MRKLLLISLTVWPVSGQLPDFYKTVDRMSWVVSDLDRATQGWSKLGFVRLEAPREMDLPEVQYRGRPAAVKIRVASGFLGDLRVNWIQPLGGQNAYTEFLKRHGDGVFSLVHRVPTLEAFNRELERLRGLGVDVLQHVAVADGSVRYAYLDTAAQGKYALGLVYVAPGLEGDPPPSGTKISQFAFVARDPKAVSALWEKLGFPAMTFTHGAMRDLRYRGKPGQFDQELGWQRQGKVAYEWIRSLKGPNVYEDHLKVHGEGIQHLGLPVEDMDSAIAAWGKTGFAEAQSGAWGEAGKKGSGRFAYIDTDSIGGLTIELLWSFRP